VRLVRPADDRPHHFGNASAGFRAGEAGGCVLHLVNLETIVTLNKTTGNTFEPSRFRANIVISGISREEAWPGDLQNKRSTHTAKRNYLVTTRIGR
jgi:uncharacterized protein YcbX